MNTTSYLYFTEAFGFSSRQIRLNRGFCPEVGIRPSQIQHLTNNFYDSIENSNQSATHLVDQRDDCPSSLGRHAFGVLRPLDTLSLERMTIPTALHTFIVLAKSAAGAACADLIKQATSANGVYTFSALLNVENVQKVPPFLIILTIACWNRI